MVSRFSKAYVACGRQRKEEERLAREEREQKELEKRRADLARLRKAQEEPQPPIWKRPDAYNRSPWTYPAQFPANFVTSTPQRALSPRRKTGNVPPSAQEGAAPPLVAKTRPDETGVRQPSAPQPLSSAQHSGVACVAHSSEEGVAAYDVPPETPISQGAAANDTTMPAANITPAGGRPHSFTRPRAVGYLADKPRRPAVRRRIRPAPVQRPPMEGVAMESVECTEREQTIVRPRNPTPPPAPVLVQSEMNLDPEERFDEMDVDRTPRPSRPTSPMEGVTDTPTHHMAVCGGPSALPFGREKLGPPNGAPPAVMGPSRRPQRIPGLNLSRRHAKPVPRIPGLDLANHSAQTQLGFGVGSGPQLPQTFTIGGSRGQPPTPFNSQTTARPFSFGFVGNENQPCWPVAPVQGVQEDVDGASEVERYVPGTPNGMGTSPVAATTEEQGAGIAADAFLASLGPPPPRLTTFPGLANSRYANAPEPQPAAATAGGESAAPTSSQELADTMHASTPDLQPATTMAGEAGTSAAQPATMAAEQSGKG